MSDVAEMIEALRVNARDHAAFLKKMQKQRGENYESGVTPEQTFYWRVADALSAATARGEKLAQFARWAIQEGPFSGYDLDGASVQEKAVSLGLIKREAYDPRKHGENADLVPGEDDYFTFDDALAALGDGE